MHPTQSIVTQDLVEAVGRFRDWTRTEQAVAVLDGVCHGSLEAENVLLGQFIKAIHPEAQISREDLE